jgi:hypothetical protein
VWCRTRKPDDKPFNNYQHAFAWRACQWKSRPTASTRSHESIYSSCNAGHQRAMVLSFGTVIPPNSMWSGGAPAMAPPFGGSSFLFPGAAAAPLPLRQRATQGLSRNRVKTCRLQHVTEVHLSHAAGVHAAHLTEALAHERWYRAAGLAAARCCAAASTLQAQRETCNQHAAGALEEEVQG